MLESLNMTSADNSSEDPRFESVRNQITKWLLAEQWKLRELSDDKTAWAIVAEDSQSKKVILAQPNDKPEVVLIQAAVNVAKEQSAKIKALEARDRQDLLWEIRFQLLNMRVKFQGVSDDPEKIIVKQHLYFENLNRNEFVRSLETVQDSILAVIWIIQKRLGQPGHTTEEGGFLM